MISYWHQWTAVRRRLKIFLQYYDTYINALVTYGSFGENGNIYKALDEDMKAWLQYKLLNAIKKWKEKL